MESTRFEINVPDARLEDLRRRLRDARFAPDFANDDWGYGINADYLRELMAHWAEEFDWREQEAQINAFPNHRVEIDGMPIHYIHAPGKGPNPMPLLISHGWPSTFWDYNKVIGPLSDPAAYGGDPADAFDVVVASTPGTAWSNPLRTPGVTVYKIADLWVKLMVGVLGYESFGAHGSDNGASTTAQLGHKYAHRVIGIHMAPGPHTLAIWDLERPWADLTGSFVPTDPAARAALIEWEKKYVSHAVVHTLDPQTLAYGMHDSPVGMAAWLLERRRAWSDCGGEVEAAFSKDELLTSFSIFWLTDSLGPSARLYRENWLNPWRPSHDRTPVVEAPTGATLFLADLPPDMPTEWMSEYYDLRFLRTEADGGHFAAMERPQVIVDHLREFFRELRPSI